MGNPSQRQQGERMALAILFFGLGLVLLTTVAADLIRSEGIGWKKRIPWVKFFGLLGLAMMTFGFTLACID